VGSSERLFAPYSSALDKLAKILLPVLDIAAGSTKNFRLVEAFVKSVCIEVKITKMAKTGELRIHRDFDMMMTEILTNPRSGDKQRGN